MPGVAPVTDPERRAATSGADPTSYMSHDDAEKFATDRAEKNIKQGKRGVVAVNSNTPGVQKLSGAEQDANKKVESDLDYLDELLGRKREGITGALFGAMAGTNPKKVDLYVGPNKAAESMIAGAFWGHLGEESIKAAYRFLKGQLSKEPTKEQVKELAEKMEKTQSKMSESESDPYIDELLGRKREGIGGAITGGLGGAIVAGALGFDVLDPSHPTALRSLAIMTGAGAAVGAMIGHSSQRNKEKELNDPKAQEVLFGMAEKNMLDQSLHHPLPTSVVNEWRQEIKDGKVKVHGWNHFADKFNGWIGTEEGQKWNNTQAKKYQKLQSKMSESESILERCAEAQVVKMRVPSNYKSYEPLPETDFTHASRAWFGKSAEPVNLKAKLGKEPTRDQIEKEAKSMNMQESRDPYIDELLGRKQEGLAGALIGGTAGLLALGPVGALVGGAIGHHLQGSGKKDVSNSQMEEFESMVQDAQNQNSHHPIPASIIKSWAKGLEGRNFSGSGNYYFEKMFNSWISTPEGKKWNEDQARKFVKDSKYESAMREGGPGSGIVGSLVGAAEHAAPAVASGAGAMVKKAAKWVAGNVAAGVVTGKVADMTMAHSKAQREDDDGEPKKTKMSESTKGLLTAHAIPVQQFGSHCVSSQLRDLPPAVENDPISVMWRQQDMLRLRGRNHVA
jgi:hypothetical protein